MGAKSKSNDSVLCHPDLGPRNTTTPGGVRCIVEGGGPWPQFELHHYLVTGISVGGHCVSDIDAYVIDEDLGRTSYVFIVLLCPLSSAWPDFSKVYGGGAEGLARETVLLNTLDEYVRTHASPPEAQENRKVQP